MLGRKQGSHGRGINAGYPRGVKRTNFCNEMVEKRRNREVPVPRRDTSRNAVTYGSAGAGRDAQPWSSSSHILRADIQTSCPGPCGYVCVSSSQSQVRPGRRRGHLRRRFRSPAFAAFRVRNRPGTASPRHLTAAPCWGHRWRGREVQRKAHRNPNEDQEAWTGSAPSWHAAARGCWGSTSRPVVGMELCEVSWASRAVGSL
jgi:hypothetical protein